MTRGRLVGIMLRVRRFEDVCALNLRSDTVGFSAHLAEQPSFPACKKGFCYLRMVKTDKKNVKELIILQKKLSPLPIIRNFAAVKQ